jgi:hypothetical protein
MADLKFLASYSGESTEELINMGEDHRIDSLVMAFEEALGKKAYQLGDAALSWPERVVLAVESLEREVNNGGYAQFYINSSKEYASVIVDALHAIACRDTAAVTLASIEALQISGSITESSIDEAMARADRTLLDRLAECDERYYELGENIAEKLFSFIRRNNDLIRLV